MIRTGLCSVTLRQLDVGAVLEVARRAGLGCVEWGGDVHVPPGDTAAATRTRQQCADAGIAVASYGSYFRPGVHPIEQWQPVLASAIALGAPRIRIWAGDVGSADADAAHWSAVVDGASAAVSAAADVGIEVGFEYHGKTLTDTAETALRLVEDVPGATSYWQPPVGLDDATALAGLRLLGPHLSTLHVFSWSATGERLALTARSDLWRSALLHAASDGRDHDALLEFVADGELDTVVADARTLTRLLAATPHT